MTYQHLQFVQRGAIAHITLNRPEVRNAFNEVMIQEISNIFAVVSASIDIRAIILRANGKAFCAGADLNWMKKMAGFTHAENVDDAGALAAMLRSIYTCPKPVVAAISGDVFAGGVGLVAACDIAVSVPTARFCLSEVKLGLIPGTIAPYVVRAIGARAAHRYALTAEVFNADEAQRVGLLHEVTGDVEAAVERYSSAFLAASPHALAECKRLLHDVAHAPINDALVADTAQRIAAIRASDEGKNGVAAFLKKAAPAWLQTPQITA